MIANIKVDHGKTFAKCHKCGSKLFEIKKDNTTLQNIEIEIMCKQRSGSKSCKTINKVVL